MVLARDVVRGMRGPARTPGKLWKEYEGRGPPRPAPLTNPLRRIGEITESRIDGRPVFMVTPRRNATGWHIVYTYGGAFVNPLRRAHWNIVARLIKATGASVSVPIYPLAPKHRHGEGFAFLESVYRGLLGSVAPGRLVLCGDSAGANLALAQTLRYRELGLPVPAHLVLFSPWLDLTLSNPEIPGVEPRDVMLRREEMVEWGRWWSGACDPREAYLRPIFADLGELPPIQVFSGTHDLMWPDAQLLRAKVRSTGGSVELHEAEAAFHVYVGATFTPEARFAFRTVGELLRA